MSAGFPEIAIRIGSEGGATQLVDPRADQLIDSFVVGRAPRNADHLLPSAKLLSAFSLVRVDAPSPGWLDRSHVPVTEDYLGPIAALGRHLTWEDLYAATQRLAERGVFKRRGGLGAIQPRPIANRLAERQWGEWDPRKWDQLLSGSLGSGLAKVAAERLAYLTVVAPRVVRHVCREGGLLDTSAVNNDRAEVLAYLAEVDANVVGKYIERLLDGHPDPSQIGDNVRHGLLRALSKIAFPTATFVVGARLMLRLLGIQGGTDSEHVAPPLHRTLPREFGSHGSGREPPPALARRGRRDKPPEPDAARCARTGRGLQPNGPLERDRPGSARLPANPESLAPGHDG